MVIVLAVSFAVGASIAAGVSRLTGTSAIEPEPGFVRVVVPAGETPWEFASRVAPRDDPALTLARLTAVNDLGSRGLVPGSVVLVPTGSPPD